MNWGAAEFQSLFLEPSRNGVYKPKEFHGSGAKIINMGELFAYDRVGGQPMARLNMTDHELLKSGVQSGDLLFGRRSLVEEGAGRCAIAHGIDEPTTFESSIIRVRLNPDLADPTFYFYYFRSPPGRALVRSIVSGATVKGIRGSDLQRLQVAQPPLITQQEIATALAKFDDLIESNQHRIALLEESARLLYREWFVNLRFPDHNSRPAKSELLSGWVSGYASDFIQVQSGGTPNTKNDRFWNGEIPFFTPKDCSGSVYVLSTEKMLSEDGLASCNSRLFPKETIFITARGTVGKLALAQRPMGMNQSCYALVPKGDMNNLFLFLALEERIAHLRAMASGGVFDAIVVDTFKKLPFSSPPKTLMDNFGVSVRPIFDQIENLLKQNLGLIDARSSLLPKLMSGEIQV